MKDDFTIGVNIAQIYIHVGYLLFPAFTNAVNMSIDIEKYIAQHVNIAEIYNSYYSEIIKYCMKNYVKRIREKLGKEPIFLNAASGIISNSNGQVLLQRLGLGEKADAWSLPGGVMEIGEGPHVTLSREIREETGLKVEVEHFVGVYTTPNLVSYPNGDRCQMVTQVFSVKVIGGSLRKDGVETLELKYFDIKKRPLLFRPHIEKALIDYENNQFGVSR